MLYTGSSDEELLFSGLDSGAQGYALKDGSPRELVEALDQVARGGSYVDPRLRPALLSRRSTERLPSLSNREREVLDLLAQGLTGEQVAERLVLSAETIKTHIRNAMTKLEAHTRVHAIAIALREGFISPPDDAGARAAVPDDAPDGIAQLRHDLRTPLTVVIGFAEILAGERPLTDDERRDYAQRVLSAGIEMRELIDSARLD